MTGTSSKYVPASDRTFIAHEISSVNKRRWIGWWTALLVLFCVANIVLLITTYSDVYMHPSQVTFHPKITLTDGLGLTWEIFRKPFEVAKVLRGAEYRYRFLMYLLLFFDQKVHYGLLQILPPHPSASILWPFTVVLTPYLLYRFLLNVTEQRHTSWMGLALFLSSVGYLSIIAQNFLTAKPFSLLFFIAILNVALSIWKTRQPGALLYRSPMRSVAVLLILLLTCFFIDESVFIVYLIVPILFNELFIDISGLKREWRGALRPIAINTVLYALPGVLFIFSVLVIVPFIASQLGYRFNTFVPVGGMPISFKQFEWYNVYRTFMSLLGTDFVPFQVSPPLAIPPNPNFYDQITNLPKLLILGGITLFCALLLIRQRKAIQPWLPRIAVAFVAFLLWQTFLQSFHIVVVNGYVYGSLYAILFAIGFALILELGLRDAWKLRVVSMLLFTVTVVTQIDNFHIINRSQVDFHQSAIFMEADIRRDIPGLKIEVDRERVATFAEALSLWRCWRQLDGTCDVFSRKVSPGAIYLLVEFYWINEARAGRIASSRP